MIQRYKKTCLLFLLGFLSTCSSVYGAVNLSLQAPTSVAVNTSFNVTVKASGTGKFAAAQIKITFDKTNVRVRSIEPAANVTAGNTSTVNANGYVVLMYLDVSVVGISAETNPEFATVTFDAIAKGQTQLIIDNWSAVADTNVKDVTGIRGTADIEIDMLILSGDMDASGAINLADAILGLKVLMGMDADGINIGADVNKDGNIGLGDVVYVLQFVSELRQ